MPQLTLTERIAESFTLARAQRAAETTPESVRKGVAEDLALSRQKADAAESLFDNGHPSEAIKLANESLEQALAAVRWLEVAPTGEAKATAPEAKRPAGDAKRAEGSDDAKAPEGDAKAPEGDAKSPEGDAKSPEGEAKASEGEAKASEGEAKSSGGEAKASEGEAKSSEGEAMSPEGEAKASDAAPSASDPKSSEGDAKAIGWRRTLEGRGAGRSLLDDVEAVVKATRASSPPRLDEQVTAEHATSFHRVLAARVAIDREIHPSALTPAQVSAKRRNRLALAAFVVIGVVAGLYFALRRPSGTYVEASAYFGNNDQFAPANAIDGNVDTEWVLPDRSSGWLDIHVGTPRRIEAVSIVNGSNPPHLDRAMREYTIEVWAHGELARSVEGTVPFSPARNPVRHEIGVDDVERVRVVVRSWHNLGGSLAEVSFE
ncbi:MAG: discoidin domain-containing protein [Sandaracinaceae bacterium]|nr:discoidin domain-containing protein [Sandaracinaceae bacterium]